jgi:hypothetical protein
MDPIAQRKFGSLREALCFVDLVSALAAPRVWAKAKALPSQAFFREHIEQYQKFLKEWPDPKILRTQKPFEKLRALLMHWEPSPELPRDLILSARVFVASWELGEPDEGWDTWEGHEDDAGPSFDAGPS